MAVQKETESTSSHVHSASIPTHKAIHPERDMWPEPTPSV